MTTQESVRPSTAERLTLWLILALSLALRLWISPHRWIGPDEGAHLMDGRLVLDGLLPGVDFISRQPFYAYILSGLQALIGPDYADIRFAAVFISIANVYIVYLIARRLFGGDVGVLAALILAFLPLGVIWAPIVHTEPFTILLSGLGLYFLVRHLQDGSGPFLVAAGITMSLALYVRESSLGPLVASGTGLVIWSAGNLRRLASRLLLFGVGFLIPCAVFGVIYLGHLTLHQWWLSQLNPLSLFIKSASELSAAVGSGAPDHGMAALRVSDQPWATTVSNLRGVLLLVSGLGVGLLASALLLVRGLVSRREERSLPWREIGLMYAWIGTLAALYGYWILHRGFFPQYAEEFLPPLCIATAWAAMQFYSQWRFSDRPVGALAGLAIFAGVAFAGVKLWPRLDAPNYWYFLVPAVGLAWVQLPGSRRVGRWLAVLATAAGWAVLLTWARGAAPSLMLPLKILLMPVVLLAVYLACRGATVGLGKSYSAYAGLTLLLTAFGMSLAASGRQLDLRYTGVWSPKVVRQVTDYLRANSKPGDEVISGAVIWEWQADRRPFARLSHPLALLARTPAALAALSASLIEQLATRPPRFIVMDGYTELTYGSQISDLQQVLDSRYSLRLTVTGSAFPVLIYRLR